MDKIKNIGLLFNHILPQLTVEMAEDLHSIHEDGRLSKPGRPHSYKFSQSLKNLIIDDAKLFGLGKTGMETDMLFTLFIEAYNPEENGWDLEDLEFELQPRGFIVGTPQKSLPFVGGSRQGELENIYKYQIVKVFGPPSWSDTSSDGKVQNEWDIKFDNGVRAMIYDYKQYDLSPEDIDYWSVGGNSPVSAFEVYKAMGLFE
tara:strand:- start:3702 stop:4307 length:606 start_codon:yes stop_codon:yes gene_type:complete